MTDETKTTPAKPATKDVKPDIPQVTTYKGVPTTSYHQPVPSNRMLTFKIEGGIMPKAGDSIRIVWGKRTFVGTAYEVIYGDTVRLNQQKG